jgi:hypothetical protein
MVDGVTAIEAPYGLAAAGPTLESRTRTCNMPWRIVAVTMQKASRARRLRKTGLFALN